AVPLVAGHPPDRPALLPPIPDAPLAPRWGAPLPEPGLPLDHTQLAVPVTLQCDRPPGGLGAAGRRPQRGQRQAGPQQPTAHGKPSSLKVCRKCPSLAISEGTDARDRFLSQSTPAGVPGPPPARSRARPVSTRRRSALPASGRPDARTTQLSGVGGLDWRQ